LRNNTKGYGGKTRQTDSQSSDTTAPSADVPFVDLAPDGQSGKFWIHPRTYRYLYLQRLIPAINVKAKHRTSQLPESYFTLYKQY